MNIFQALKIRKDITRLYQNKGQRQFIPFNYSNFYQIRIPNDRTIIESNRREKYFSPNEFIPCTFWTNLIGTAGNFATVPLTFTVVFNNNGMLPHAPMEQGLRIHGFAARLIYNKMKKEHLADWHKTLREQQGKRK